MRTTVPHRLHTRQGSGWIAWKNILALLPEASVRFLPIPRHDFQGGAKAICILMRFLAPFACIVASSTSPSWMSYLAYHNPGQPSAGGALLRQTRDSERWNWRAIACVQNATHRKRPSGMRKGRGSEWFHFVTALRFPSLGPETGRGETFAVWSSLRSRRWCVSTECGRFGESG